MTSRYAMPLLGFAALLVAGCVADRATPTPGEALYVQYCAVCHGEDGRSVEGMLSTPHLNNQALLTVVDDEFLRENTARGRPGPNGRGKPGTKMSVYGEEHGGPLTATELALIVAHIRSWQTEPSVALDPFVAGSDAEAGRVLYETHCLACHGEDGWGEIAPSLAGVTFQDTATDAMIRHAIRNGREGTTMPAFQLTDAEIGDLISYIRTLE